MSVLHSDDRGGAIDDNANQPESASSPRARIVGVTFAIVAGVAMAGWLYLIGKVVWSSINWLLF
jgi:hypothetical protein